jgi:LuxR family maltose regulon positive regulatory protein
VSEDAVPGSSGPVVVNTKPRVPALRSEQLLRPGLLELLETGVDRKITLVSAPAGYGKTTLLPQWLHSEEANGSFAWVTLDGQDNDPVRMWRHIVEALGQVAPGEGFGADVLVGLSGNGTRLVETALPMLVNELGELSYQMVVVLDDYHFVTDYRYHESVDFFIAHLPDNVHLVLATRSDPTLHLGRLRARGELNEIRTQQLAFSEEEVASLLNEKLHLQIGSDDLSVLLDRTEGWPTGIYLAVLSMQGEEDVHGFIETFGGSNRYIVDLLGDEILAGLPEEEREFLFRTSVLRKLTGPLCDAVVGREGSGLLLGELARSNLS